MLFIIKDIRVLSVSQMAHIMPGVLYRGVLWYHWALGPAVIATPRTNSFPSEQAAYIK